MNNKEKNQRLRRRWAVKKWILRAKAGGVDQWSYRYDFRFIYVGIKITAGFSNFSGSVDLE